MLKLILHQDNPWLVRTRYHRDRFLPKWMTIHSMAQQKVVRDGEMTAREARLKNLPVDENIPDDQKIQISWEENLPYEIEWSERRLYKRRMPRKVPRVREIRFELAYALSNPGFFLDRDNRVLKTILNEHLKSMTRKVLEREPIPPKILVFLGTKEDSVFAKEIYLVNSVENNVYQIQDRHGEEFTLKLDPEIQRMTRSSCLVMFFPSNVEVVEE